LFTIFVILFFG